MKPIVVIDLETTGLDPQKDAIIEIAAVRFSGSRVEAEFETLINPNRHIPENITQLTGIDDAMVRNAPRIAEVLAELESFCGDLPILGQNVRFDLGFLRRQRVLAFNEAVDTYEMASVLLPSASRYNLGALGQLLGIPLSATHRAMDDVRVTLAVYQRLVAQASELPLEVLSEIVRMGEPLEWDGNFGFQEALRLRAKEPVQAKRVKPGPAGPLFAEAESAPPARPLGPVKEALPLDVDEVASILEYGGPFSSYFETYEQRPEQVEMLRAVTNSLSYSQHLMVEAGTGVGKSFAYLVPAALFAIQNNTRVVVSTNTINLQDQLINKDIPAVREALQIPLRAAVLKGRANYLCPRRLDILRQQGPRNEEEVRVLAKTLVWTLSDSSGDRGNLNLNRPQEKDVWMKLSAEDEACSSENCASKMGGICPFYRAKQAAQAAHILVVNHALLLSDVAAEGKVLPEYQYLVIDEGHHLEAATTGAMSFRMSQADFERLIREVGGSSSGILGNFLRVVTDLVRPSDFATLANLVHRASDLSFRLENQARDFFYGLMEFMQYMQEGRPQSLYAFSTRILPATRTAQGWDNVEISWDSTGETMRLLIKVVGEAYKAASELYAAGVEEIEDPLGSISGLYRRLTEAETAISGMMHDPKPETIYWVEIQPQNKRLTLNTAPLRIGPLIQKYLWHEKEAVILTSATLTAAGDFGYVRNTLMAEEADELTLGSPFDYESSTLLFIAKDIPEPNAPGYEQAVNRAIAQTAIASNGRMLALFTSYAQLKRASQAVKPLLRDHDIQIYEQGEGASPQSLLESFKNTERAVLLGTRSFWEGVDLPGESLQVVVLTKIPFEVPSDPIVAARSETFDDPFGEYQVPEAILKFRQGFGRLIRSASDRGVVAVLDRRVLTKQYGRLFLGSLPQCSVRQGNAAELPRLTEKWIGM
ncbi:MAG: helicase C-terminal domain-containing protein [Anaerolineales bacterium]|jgi:DNA polymerase-3 subunit epsilon/ATP-dependent DNA helicase DinG|nr:helicase C-terminal domain-containing protein [Anaerolineales bacterium]